MTTRLGKQVVVTGTNPAAGVELSETVPAGQWWRVLGIQGSLVATGVANRNVVLTYDDGTTVFFRTAAGGNQTDATTCVYQYATDMVTNITTPTTLQTFQIPPWTLGPGYRIKTVTANIAVGDEWGAPLLLVVKYTVDPTGWV